MGKNPTHLVQRGGREKLRRQRVGCGGRTCAIARDVVGS